MSVRDEPADLHQILQRIDERLRRLEAFQGGSGNFLTQAQIPAEHDDLDGVTANQHHAEAHDDDQHTDGPNSKPGHTHSHDTDLTGVSANDHHNEDHASRHAADGADPYTVKYKSAAGATISDADYASTPPNGTIAIAHNTTTGKSYLYGRANGAWKSVEIS